MAAGSGGLGVIQASGREAARSLQSSADSPPDPTLPSSPGLAGKRPLGGFPDLRSWQDPRDPLKARAELLLETLDPS